MVTSSSLLTDIDISPHLWTVIFEFAGLNPDMHRRLFHILVGRLSASASAPLRLYGGEFKSSPLHLAGMKSLSFAAYAASTNPVRMCTAWALSAAMSMSMHLRYSSRINVITSNEARETRSD
jgi:hypothetical protein